MRGHQERQQPQQLPIQFPTQGRRPDSPDSMVMFAPTPSRVSEELGRRIPYPPVNVDLANVPPERRLDEYNTRSMVDLDRMGQASGLSPMELLNRKYKQNLQRGAQGLQRRETPNTRAKNAEKDMQKYLRRQM